MIALYFEKVLEQHQGALIKIGKALLQTALASMQPAHVWAGPLSVLGTAGHVCKSPEAGKRQSLPLRIHFVAVAQHRVERTLWCGLGSISLQIACSTLGQNDDFCVQEEQVS